VELASLNQTTGPQSVFGPPPEGEVSPSSAQNAVTNSLDLVTQAVINAFRIVEMPDKPLMDGVIERLHGRQLLLVLDNCEHLIAACADLVGQLLNQCPALKILATSREPLNVPGEKSWPAPVLSLPLPEQAEAQIFLTSEAVRLFVERAADAQPGYQPGEPDAAAIANICLHLDGLPLAIELAAARMNLLTTTEIAARLDQRFSLLTGGYRTSLPRHQTLQAAIEWSYNLLAENEQTLFRRLTIFSGSFTLEAGEAVCVDPAVRSEDFITIFGHLVEKSLLRVELTSQDTAQPTRYRFLNSIHTFGRIKLEETGELAQMRRQQANYYVQLVETAEPELLAQKQVHWSKRLQAETDNLRAVIEWSSETGEEESALRLVGALLWFWFSYGSTREGCDLSVRAITLSNGHRFQASRARALNTAGFLLCLLGDTVRARQFLEEALSLHRISQNRAMLAWTLQLLGFALAYDQEYDRADMAFNEGLAFTQGPDGVRESNFLHFRGDIDMLRGDFPRAKKVYEESAGMLRSIGSQSFLAYPLRRLGYLALREKNFKVAGQYFRESLQINREIGDQRALIACLASVAALAAQTEKPFLASRLYGYVESQLDSLSVKLLYTDQLEVQKIRSEFSIYFDEPMSKEFFNEGWEMNEEQAVQLGEQVFERTE
jgi:predicted ATPase